jgi:hypothetical protein
MRLALVSAGDGGTIAVTSGFTTPAPMDWA